MAESGPTVPVGTLAKLFDLTERRVQQLARDGIIPKATRGQYPLIESVRGYVRFLQERAQGEGPGNIKDSIREQQLRRIRIENDARERQLLPKEEVREAFNLAMQSIRFGARALSARLAPIVVRSTVSEARRQIDEETDDFLNDAAAAVASLGVDARVRAPAAPAKKKVSRSVGRRKKKATKRKPRAR